MLYMTIPENMAISSATATTTLMVSAVSYTHLFGVIFLLILLNSVRQIYKSKPVELLRSDNMGEREPKAKWIFAVLGIICLGTGYYIAVTTTNPVAAFAMFFVAVILVIIGTYPVSYTHLAMVSLKK